MDTYSIFRQIADSWVLLAMFAFFLATVAWAFRPGSSKTYADVADIPFRHEFQPADNGDNTPDVNPEEAR